MDVSVRDLRHMVDFFGNYGAGLGSALSEGYMVEVEMTNPSLFNSMIKSHSSTSFKGVEIACEGDMEILGLDKFTEAAVPDGHPTYEEAKRRSPELSRHMGIPPFVRKVIPLDLIRAFLRIGRPHMDTAPLINREAVFLNLHANTKRSNWAFADILSWDTECGRVLVVREDKKDITPEQVEAVAHYCRFVASPTMHEHSEKFDGMVEQEELSAERSKFIKEHLCRARFDDFWEKFKKDKIAEGNVAWKEVLSPYAGTDEEGGRLDSGELSDDEEEQCEQISRQMAQGKCGPQ